MKEKEFKVIQSVFFFFFVRMQVKSFKTPEEVDDWLFRNPMQVPGALHFVDVSPSLITYGLQTNSTPIARRGHYEDPTFKFQIPLQIAAEREIARSIIKGLKSLICQIFYVEIVLDTQISFFSLIKSCETNSFFFFLLKLWILSSSNLYMECRTYGICTPCKSYLFCGGYSRTCLFPGIHHVRICVANQ